MGFDRIVKIDKSPELKLAVGAVLELGFAVPHLHQGADDALGLAVGLGPVDLSELLADAVVFAGFHERVAVGALVFLAIV